MIDSEKQQSKTLSLETLSMKVLAFILFVSLLSAVIVHADDGRNIKATRKCSREETQQSIVILQGSDEWTDARWTALQNLFSCSDARFISEKTLVKVGSKEAYKEVDYKFDDLALSVSYIYGQSLSVHPIEGITINGSGQKAPK